jgi:hypothetical protein
MQKLAKIAKVCQAALCTAEICQIFRLLRLSNSEMNCVVSHPLRPENMKCRARRMRHFTRVGGGRRSKIQRLTR